MKAIKEVFLLRLCSFQEDGETFVKTMSDCWIVGRKSDQRELFVILNQKNANLIEIDGECSFTQETPVVYHLRRQTGQFKVWVNDKEKSQISSIHRKTAAKTRNWYQRWLLRNTTLNRNFRLEYFDQGNRTTFSDIPLFPGIFRWNDPKCRVPFTFQPDFPETFCKW